MLSARRWARLLSWVAISVVVISTAARSLPARALDFVLDIPLAVERAALAAAYLAGAEREDGGFVYEYDFAAGGSSDADNIVRQAGAGFVLAHYLAHSRDLSHAPRVSRALEFYEGKSLDFREGKLVAAGGDATSANAGATALAMLTELFYFEATGDARFAPLRADWLEGLAALWLPHGGFAATPGSERSSPYFDGESWLALAHYQRLFPDHAPALALLDEADRHFLAHYGNSLDIGFAHWGLMAAAIRHQATRDPAFLAFSARTALGLLDELGPEISPDTNACYLVEGLAAAAGEFEGVGVYAPLLDRISARIETELYKSLLFQVRAGQTQIDLAPGRFFYDEALGTQAGAFLNGRYALKSRVDFTQHCLSALMVYEKWQRQRSE